MCGISFRNSEIFNKLFKIDSAVLFFCKSCRPDQFLRGKQALF